MKSATERAKATCKVSATIGSDATTGGISGANCGTGPATCKVLATNRERCYHRRYQWSKLRNGTSHLQGISDYWEWCTTGGISEAEAERSTATCKVSATNRERCYHRRYQWSHLRNGASHLQGISDYRERCLPPEVSVKPRRNEPATCKVSATIGSGATTGGISGVNDGTGPATCKVSATNRERCLPPEVSVESTTERGQPPARYQRPIGSGAYHRRYKWSQRRNGP